MPGPSNARKKKTKKKEKRNNVNPEPRPSESTPKRSPQPTDSRIDEQSTLSPSPLSTIDTKHLPAPPQSPCSHPTSDSTSSLHPTLEHTLPPPPLEESQAFSDDDPIFALLQQRQPPIYDPGNGPRVRNMRAFLSSSFAHQCSDEPLRGSYIGGCRCCKSANIGSSSEKAWDSSRG